MRDIVEINKDLIPYSFDILLADEWYELYVDYNKTADMFTVAVYKEDEFIGAEPLVLDMPLFGDVYKAGFPAVTLVPYAPAGDEKRVTYDNLGKTVFLSVDDEGGEEDGI